MCSAASRCSGTPNPVLRGGALADRFQTDADQAGAAWPSPRAPTRSSPVARYPGLLELLPFRRGRPRLRRRRPLQKLRCSKTGRTAEPAGLQEAAATWKLLRAAPPDPRHMSLCRRLPAGHRHRSPADRRHSDRWPPARKRLDSHRHARGRRHRELEQSAALAGARPRYAEDRRTIALCAPASRPPLATS